MLTQTTLTPERRRLFEQIATLTAGHRASDVTCALCDNLWQAAAAMCDTPEAVERMLFDLVPNMVRDARANWTLVMEAKLHGAGASGRGRH